ncbi:MAG: hypothetical protein Q8Q05_02515 [bacterium]|nr:hypothetical protein [bacterium]
MSVQASAQETAISSSRPIVFLPTNYTVSASIIDGLRYKFGAQNAISEEANDAIRRCYRIAYLVMSLVFVVALVAAVLTSGGWRGISIAVIVIDWIAFFIAGQNGADIKGQYDVSVFARNQLEYSDPEIWWPGLGGSPIIVRTNFESAAAIWLELDDAILVEEFLGDWRHSLPGGFVAGSSTLYDDLPRGFQIDMRSVLSGLEENVTVTFSLASAQGLSSREAIQSALQTEWIFDSGRSKMRGLFDAVKKLARDEMKILVSSADWVEATAEPRKLMLNTTLSSVVDKVARTGLGKLTYSDVLVTACFGVATDVVEPVA